MSQNPLLKAHLMLLQVGVSNSGQQVKSSPETWCPPRGCFSEGEAFPSSAEMFEYLQTRTEQTTQRSIRQSWPALFAPETLVILSLPALVRRLCCDFCFDHVPQIKDSQSSKAQQLTSLTEQIEDR